jgi:gliding motility-associated-like protein
MKYAKLILLYFSFCCFVDAAVAQSIVVDDSKNAQELVENILVNSSCATIANPTASGDNFSGSNKSYGYFNNQGGTFPFAEGVVLSTWSSQNSIGPYVASTLPRIGGGNDSWIGDADLEQALAITNTKNATFLEFEFTPKTNFISFNYIFASDEYRFYFPCEFSDGFAFLIKEKGSLLPYKNIAVIPGSSTAVSSTTIHPLIPPFNRDGVVRSGCPADNETYFQGYNTGLSPINYAGQTTILKAQSNVIPNTTYVIKLVIADSGNVTNDSAVFIEAGSFAPKINLGSDQTVCFGGKTILDAGSTGNTNTYQWFKDGGTTPIGSNSTLEVNSAGQYSVLVSLAAGCVATGTINIAYKNPILKSLTQCGDSSGNATFDLTTLTTEIANGSTNAVEYFETVADLQNQSPTITNTANYNSASKIIYARVTNSAGCVNVAEITLQVLATFPAIQKLAFCDNDALQDGIRVFNLFKEINPMILPVVASPLIVEGYYLSANDATNKQNALPINFTSTTNQQTLFTRVENGLDCRGIFEIQLEINIYTPAIPGIIKGTVVNQFSGDSNSILIETMVAADFEYSLDGITFQSNPLFTNISAGVYKAFVRDNSSCGLSFTTVYVLDYPRFFTPNGDGFNDVWLIKNLTIFPNATINIFNRFGKLLKQVNSSNQGWNGIFNGEALPSDDYWFTLKADDKRIIKGHFSLKR